MKKYLSICFIISLFLLTVTVYATSSLVLTWKVLDAKITPGGTTNVILTLTNPSLLTDVRNVKLSIDSGPYLSTSLASQEIGGISAGKSQDTSIFVTASKDATSTNSYILVKARYYSDSTEQETAITIPINIRRQPILQIENVNFNKDIIEPGNTVTLSFDVKNYGDGSAKNVGITLNQDKDIFTASGSGESFADVIEPTKSFSVSYLITINPSVVISTYTIPITLNYLDEMKSDSYSTEKYVGMVISGKLNLVLTLESQDNLVAGSKGSATIKIANSGTQDAQSLTVKFLPSKLFVDVTPDTVYVGKIKADDFETEKVMVYTSSDATSGNHPLNFQVNYKDSYGNDYTENHSINLKILSLAEASEGNFLNNLLIALGFATVVLIIFFTIMRRRKKKVSS